LYSAHLRTNSPAQVTCVLRAYADRRGPLGGRCSTGSPAPFTEPRAWAVSGRFNELADNGGWVHPGSVLPTSFPKFARRHDHGAKSGHRWSSAAQSGPISRLSCTSLLPHHFITSNFGCPGGEKSCVAAQRDRVTVTPASCVWPLEPSITSSCASRENRCGVRGESVEELLVWWPESGVGPRAPPHTVGADYRRFFLGYVAPIVFATSRTTRTSLRVSLGHRVVVG
jgi:hypothetical protein